MIIYIYVNESWVVQPCFSPPHKKRENASSTTTTGTTTPTDHPDPPDAVDKYQVYLLAVVLCIRFSMYDEYES